MDGCFSGSTFSTTTYKIPEDNTDKCNHTDIKERKSHLDSSDTLFTSQQCLLKNKKEHKDGVELYMVFGFSKLRNKAKNWDEN